MRLLVASDFPGRCHFLFLVLCVHLAELLRKVRCKGQCHLAEEHRRRERVCLTWLFNVPPVELGG